MKIKQLAVSLNNENSVNIYNLSKRFAVFICLICVFQLMASNKFSEKNIGIVYIIRESDQTKQETNRILWP